MPTAERAVEDPTALVNWVADSETNVARKDGEVCHRDVYMIWMRCQEDSKEEILCILYDVVQSGGRITGFCLFCAVDGSSSTNISTYTIRTRGS